MTVLTEAPLMLTVSGARGIVGRTMTPSVVAEFAAAFGSFLRASTGIETPVLCLGRDSRPSGSMLADAAGAGLVSVGCRVVRLGIVTTPTVAVMMKEHQADGGMMVTASHNPIQWNGLKCLNADGVAPPAGEAEEIIRRFKERDIAYADVAGLGFQTDDETGHVTHVGKVLSHIDPEPIRAEGFRVVLDSVNGAGCVAGRFLLEELGCEVIHLNGEPHGRFAHTPEPIAENLTDLAEKTRQHGAAVGFAQDPDADRLAIVDETGRYIGEEYTLALATKRVFEMRGGGMGAANLSTSRMIDDIAASFPNSRILRTAVGEAHVAGAMKEQGAVIGGEGNGGVIFPPVCWVRDSLSSMALVLSAMASEKRPLSEMADSLPRYAMVKCKYDLSAVGGRDRIEPMLEQLRQEYAGERLNDADGLRIDFAEAGSWVHLRASNTEPIVRLIAEGRTDEQAWELIRSIASTVGLS